MFGRETRMLSRHYLEQGSSKSELARQLGVSRDTIHRWVRDGDLERDVDAEAVRYGPRPPVATKLDAYKPIIEARLTAYPELSSVRLFDEIRAAGYAGGYSQLKAYVRRVRPLPAPEPLIRFETPAGRQAQVDFARFRFDWGVRYALLVVLGYSRVLWCRFYPRQDMATLMDGLEEAFGSFGGVPQELLFDQMKAVITRDPRLEGGALVRNAEFFRFAHHWGFTPRACRPYRAQTKGKVERPVRYLRGNFVYGRTFLHDADLDHQRQLWLDRVANVRVHGTMRERPRDRFDREERFLRRSFAPSSPSRIMGLRRRCCAKAYMGCGVAFPSAEHQLHSTNPLEPLYKKKISRRSLRRRDLAQSRLGADKQDDCRILTSLRTLPLIR